MLIWQTGTKSELPTFKYQLFSCHAAEFLFSFDTADLWCQVQVNYYMLCTTFCSLKCHSKSRQFLYKVNFYNTVEEVGRRGKRARKLNKNLIHKKIASTLISFKHPLCTTQWKKHQFKHLPETALYMKTCGCATYCYSILEGCSGGENCGFTFGVLAVSGVEGLFA